MSKLSNIFSKIIKEKQWEDDETLCGWKSKKEWTSNAINTLNFFINKFEIRTIFDAGCGDFNWMRYVDLKNVQYTGCDVVEELLEKAKENAKSSKVNANFILSDITETTPKKFDLIVCRNTLVYLNAADITKAIDNFKESGSKYVLMSTHFLGENYSYKDLESGESRFLDMNKLPFGLPPALFYIYEGYYQDMMGFWELEKISYFDFNKIKPIPAMKPKYKSFSEFESSEDYKQLLKTYEIVQNLPETKEA